MRTTGTQLVTWTLVWCAVACGPSKSAPGMDVLPLDATPEAGPVEDLSTTLDLVVPPDALTKAPEVLLSVAPPSTCGCQDEDPEPGAVTCGWYSAETAEILVGAVITNAAGRPDAKITNIQLFYSPEGGPELLLDEGPSSDETRTFDIADLPEGARPPEGETTPVPLRILAISNLQDDGDDFLQDEFLATMLVDLALPQLEILKPESGPVIEPYMSQMDYEYWVQDDGSGIGEIVLSVAQQVVTPAQESVVTEEGISTFSGLLDTSEFGTATTVFKVQASDCVGNTTLSEVPVALVGAPKFLYPPVVECDETAQEMSTGPNRKVRLEYGDADDDAADILVAAHEGIYVAWNQGDAVFGKLSLLADAYKGADARFVDLTGDGVPEAVALYRDGPDFVVNVFRQLTDANGQGTHQFDLLESHVVGEKAFKLEIADVNLDGYPDILAAHETEEQSVALLLHLGGDGTDGDCLAQAEFITGVDKITNIAIADINSDGAPDIVTTQGESGIISTYLNTGDGDYLMAHNSLLLAHDMPFLDLGDFDQDGTIDALVYADDLGVVGLLKGLDDGYFDTDGLKNLGTGDATQNRIASILSEHFDDPLPPKAGGAAVVGWDTTMVLVDDFNLDGVPDVVAPEMQYGLVQLFWGAGDGTLAESYFLNASPKPFSLDSGHVNGDGIPDMAVLRMGLCGVALFISRSEGGCGQPGNQVTIPCPNESEDASAIGIPLWSTAAEIPAPVHPDWFDEGRTKPQRIIATDLDFDGNVDAALIVSPPLFTDFNCGYGGEPEEDEPIAGTTHSVISYMGIGRPDLSVDMYRSPMGPDFGDSIADVSTGDYNDDGIMDLAVSTTFFNQNLDAPAINMDILSGGYAVDPSVEVMEDWVCGKFKVVYPFPGAFLSTSGSAFCSYPVALGTARLNDDDVDDLMTAHRGSNTVSPDKIPDRLYIFQNQWQGGTCSISGESVPAPAAFCPTWDSPVCSPEWSVCQVDQEIAYPLTGHLPVAMDTGDVNNDGITDIVVANSDSQDVTLALGWIDQEGTYQLNSPSFPIKIISLGEEPQDIALGDVDGDGFLDMAAAFPEKVSISWGADGSNFKTPLFIEKTPDGKLIEPHIVRVADFNQDARADILVLSKKTSRILLYISLGDRNFAGPYEFISAAQPVDLQLTDINHDGCTDILVANQGARTFSLLVNEFCGW